MDQLRGLFLDSFDHVRMTMARRADSHARVAIQKDVAVDVFDPNAAGALGSAVLISGRFGVARTVVDMFFLTPLKKANCERFGLEIDYEDVGKLVREEVCT
jgi:hypothetical protein